ncbi:hypothetical protein F5B22DRAFT_641914 [Xylaria bambusicola]|uniref:uncharacterized protein n=1 Tax=Xylaria bambusicola TaxID=326684 RepID=UPI0020080C14|nr:uncharacterized protein F5B22DRAFT_641914 [Xylaria bambusicola]KAI0525763.1 hypothetical protein F5B22DRAFT_641914 [Xylaria bambusicola]
MTTVRIAFLWCHRAVDKPYRRLAIRSNTTISLGDVHPLVTTTSSSSSTRTTEGILPPPVSLHSPSYENPSRNGSLVSEGTRSTKPPDGNHGEPSTAELRSSEARIIGDTFIASITTLTRPPLTTPTALTSQTSSTTHRVFPTVSANTTNLTHVATPGRYTNSSTAAPTTSAAASVVTTPSTNEFCTTSSHGPFTTVIEYSIIYTWTITWYGDPADYTPPFPTISTPRACTPTTSATGRFTVSVCDSSGQSCSLVHTTDDPSAAAPSSISEPWWVTDTSAIRGMQPTLTFVTTDKNPAVVFSSSPPPDYGGSPDPMGNVHSAPYPNHLGSSDAPSYGDGAATGQDIRSTPVTTPITTTSPITVTVKPSVVVIDDQTFTDDPAKPTSTVVVDHNTFTIDPTRIVGAGATVTRPSISPRASSPQPTKITTIGDIPVDVEGSTVIIDQTTFTIGPKPTTVVIKGQTVTLRPGAIIFPSQTLVIPTVQDTTQVVFGAELITAIGSDRAVIEGRTITYRPGSTTVTEEIDGDTILIGPSGIILHGETYGGGKAASTEVEFAAAGGVTISQIGPTVVVVQGVTYTLSPLSPGQTATTIILGDETITIGSEGVAIETWTLKPPYISTTTITPSNGAAVALAPATATATATAINTNNNKKNSGSCSTLTRPHWALSAYVATIACIIQLGILYWF